MQARECSPKGLQLLVIVQYAFNMLMEESQQSQVRLKDVQNT